MVILAKENSARAVSNAKLNVVELFIRNKKIPVYFDWGKVWVEDDAYRAIRSKLYGLSFIPEHAALQIIRRRCE